MLRFLSIYIHIHITYIGTRISWPRHLRKYIFRHHKGGTCSISARLNCLVGQKLSSYKKSQSCPFHVDYIFRAYGIGRTEWTEFGALPLPTWPRSPFDRGARTAERGQIDAPGSFWAFNGLSHTRASDSGSEEPDSALSDDLTVQRNGQVWSSHDFGSRACTGGFGSCSCWHRWWIGITQSYWHPCNTHEIIPWKKGQGLKVRHWLAVNGDSLNQFTGSSFQFQFLHGMICGDWMSASKTV